MRSPGVQGLGLDVGAQRSSSAPAIGANLLTWTEQFQNAAWVKASATITADGHNDPNGAATADEVAFASAAGTVSQTSGVAAATGSGNFNATPTSVWTRFSVTATFDVGAYTFSVWLLDPLDAGATVRVGLDVSGGFIRARLRDNGDNADFFAWGAKLETGSTPTGDATNYGARTT